MDSSSVPLEVFSTSTTTSSPQPSLNSSASFPTTAAAVSANATANATKVSKTKLLRLGSSMGLAVPLALTRRVWKGAAYASWSVGFELQHEMGQALLRNHHRFSLTDLCQLSADFAAGPPADSSSVRTVYCGGIRADMVQYHSPVTAHRRKSLSSSSSTSSSSSSSSNKNDDRNNRSNLSKSEGGSRGARVFYRSKRHSLEDDEVELQNLSKTSSTTTRTTTTTLTSPAPEYDDGDDSDDAQAGRTKLLMRRIKSENDNLGRDNQFVNHAEADDKNKEGYDDDEPAATVLYLHGGGFCVGSATTYRRCLWHFSREMKGLRFLAVDYSLSPHVRFPTAIQECLHAYLWLIDENGGNMPPEKVVLAGDSAGGCLVLALLFLIRQMRDDAAAAAAINGENDKDDKHNDNTETEADEGDDEQEVKEDANSEQTESKAKGNTKLPFALPSRKTPPAFPLCAFLMSPWVDLSESSSVMQPESYAQPASYRSQSGLARRFIDAYLGNDDDAAAATGKKSKAKNSKKDKATTPTPKQVSEETRPDVLSPYISPLYGDMHGLPPVMLTAGGEEPLLADIRALHAKCVDAGLEVELDVGEHMNHAYQVFHDPSAHREIERSIQAVGRFVWRHIAQRQLD